MIMFSVLVIAWCCSARLGPSAELGEVEALDGKGDALRELALPPALGHREALQHERQEGQRAPDRQVLRVRRLGVLAAVLARLGLGVLGDDLRRAVRLDARRERDGRLGRRRRARLVDHGVREHAFAEARARGARDVDDERRRLEVGRAVHEDVVGVRHDDAAVRQEELGPRERGVRDAVVLRRARRAHAHLKEMARRCHPRSVGRGPRVVALPPGHRRHEGPHVRPDLAPQRRARRDALLEPHDDGVAEGGRRRRRGGPGRGSSARRRRACGARTRSTSTRRDAAGGGR
mmetsp:Transcript_26354/g.105488  ORF Transcript_26354/g.105488 Transcript_26354/m.105488 type:complete len:290 (-) Transcript_26354:834-1703(-)